MTTPCSSKSSSLVLEMDSFTTIYSITEQHLLLVALIATMCLMSARGTVSVLFLFDSFLAITNETSTVPRVYKHSYTELYIAITVCCDTGLLLSGFLFLSPVCRTRYPRDEEPQV